jgi:hypothetical protein
MHSRKRCHGVARTDNAFIALMICAFFAAGPAPAAAQVNFDRPGGDYANFAINPADPALCAARCERDGRCRAWAFSYPTTGNSAGACWLKNIVPPRTEATCCASGVRGTGVIEPRGGPVE